MKQSEKISWLACICIISTFLFLCSTKYNRDVAAYDKPIKSVVSEFYDPVEPIGKLLTDDIHRKYKEFKKYKDSKQGGVLTNDLRDMAEALWQKDALLAGDESNGETLFSSFLQCEVADAMLDMYDLSGDKFYLERACNAVSLVITDEAKGGLCRHTGDNTWIKTTFKDEDTYYLLGHLKSLPVLLRLGMMTGDAKYTDLYASGMKSLRYYVKYYDNGYCLNDSNKKSIEKLRFRLVDRYSGEPIKIAAKVALKNMYTDDSHVLLCDTNGCYSVDIPPVDDLMKSDGYMLCFSYKDDAERNIILQKESQLVKAEWIDVKDGDLFFSGSGEQRDWLVPLRISDMGERCSYKLLGEYLSILEQLSAMDEDVFLNSLKCRVAGYYNQYILSDEYVEVVGEVPALPPQSPMIDVFSFDDNQVVRHHGIINGVTGFDSQGAWKTSTKVGEPTYSPYWIAAQATQGKAAFLFCKYKEKDFQANKDTGWSFLTKDKVTQVQKEPALAWIERNADCYDGVAVWHYGEANVYNDMVQEPGWISAYGQAVLMEAMLTYPERYKELLKAGAYAYGKTLEKGGYATIDMLSHVWFEEVPNASHILNADIFSINILYKIDDMLGDSKIYELAEAGYKSLRENLWRYDTGYWSKYDMNPKKDILLQLDWLSGQDSILIDKIELLDPISKTKTVIDVGSASDANIKMTNISGGDWGQSSIEDGKSVRCIENGRAKGNKRTDSTMEQNSFMRLVLPPLVIRNYFDLIPYRLRIYYKDVAKGLYKVRIQPINEGWKLDFVDLPQAEFATTGTGEWCVKEIALRPQDLGWYMGKDYQNFHVEQLKQISEKTNDLVLAQYVQKWSFYADKKQ